MDSDHIRIGAERPKAARAYLLLRKRRAKSGIDSNVTSTAKLFNLINYSLMTIVRPRLNDFFGLRFTQEEVDFWLRMPSLKR